MKIQIVDINDKIIGLKERGILNYEEDIYRVSALWITNSEGKILLARRSLSKKHDPGKWGPAVAGTIDEEETYESNIIKEAEEELGLKNIKPKKSIKNFKKGKYKHFTQWFTLKIEKEIENIIYDKNEVAEIKWFTKEEILNLDSEEILEGIKELLDKLK